VSRLPLRWQVTLAFAGVLAAVLSAVGAFVYLRFDAELGQTLDRGLRARASEVSAAVQASPDRLARPDAPALESDESIAQVLGDDGRIVAATAAAGLPLLDPADLTRGQTMAVFADRPGDARFDESIRLLAVPVQARGEGFVVVVGASLDEKREALSSLLLLEVIGLGAALLVSSGVGYAVAGLALRPVDAMRRRAEEVTDQPDVRLPVPAVDDELGRLGRTLNDMLERLDRARAGERSAIAEQRRFVADASHELRTPLTILKSEIDVALMGPRSVAELEAALASAAEETERLCRLADDLLVLAQVDEGRLPVHCEPLRVAEVVVRVADRQRRRAQAQGRALVVEVPSGLTVVADRQRLEQAITNLVDNALRHGSGDVELVAAEVDGTARIGVRDHGPGFSKAARDHAFERFSRGSAASSSGGAGLGLAIVQAVAQAQGGSVEARHTAEGPCVEITLPLA